MNEAKMNIKIFFSLCAAAMLYLMIMRRHIYQVSMMRCVPLTVCVSLVGLFGTYVMYYIENGEWGGQSFFGALLFFPLLLIIVSFIFRMNLLNLLDYATIPGVALLAASKWHCYVNGCCGGKVLRYNGDGIPTYFPSQIVEMVAAIVLCLFLLCLEKKGRHSGRIYPICIFIYGLIRYVLNLFRWEQGVFLLGLPAGNFWSIVSIIIGAVWLIVVHFKRPKIQRSE